jgi:transposase-like protein
VRWCLRFGLSYRDVELLAERGVEVDQVTVYRWVHRSRRCSPRRPDRPLPAWQSVVADETYVKVGGAWRYVHRAVDEYGQVIDVYGVLRPSPRAVASSTSVALSQFRIACAVGSN